MPKFYLTTPIYYVNARPHLGHTYTTVVADTIARYKRMCGYDVVFLTGTDEHGQKVERAAKAAGVTPQQFADQISAEYRRLWQELDLTFDRFIRTTEWRHERAVQILFEKAQDGGYVYKGHYEGQYCVFDEMYVDEPLPGGLCPECKRPTERIREENYFFKLAAFQDRLLEYYDKHPEFVQPETRRNEVIAFVRSGLRDLSISRTSFKWGIPWPGDGKHIFYVWSDALTSYMSGIGYGDDELQFEKYWPADLHLIGKEILRFHAVYWPAFLMAAGEALPRTVFAHGWWTFQGEKMSKSRGNIQDAQPIARVLGADALRYFLLREMVFGQDGNFSREALVTRYNSDLANGLGNLASRTLAMIQQYCGGQVPAPRLDQAESGANALRSVFRPTIRKVVGNSESGAPGHYQGLDFSLALQDIWRLVAEVDSYLVREKPWALAKDSTQQERLSDVLYNASDALRIITILAHPVIPQATQRIWEQMGQPGRVGDQRIDKLDWGQLKPGATIGTIEPVFPRVEHAETYERIEAMEQEMHGPPGTPPAGAAAPAAAPATPAKIGIEDFAKVEMRVGEIKSAERVAGADKLLKVLVDIGSEVRQVVAGIAEYYKPEEIVGRKVVVVVNLAPRKLRGVESNGMIVAASVGPEGRPVLCTFTEDVAIGSRLK
jgi:methionyl-tRNA synthetase